MKVVMLACTLGLALASNLRRDLLSGDMPTEMGTDMSTDMPTDGIFECTSGCEISSDCVLDAYCDCPECEDEAPYFTCETCGGCPDFDDCGDYRQCDDLVGGSYGEEEDNCEQCAAEFVGQEGGEAACACILADPWCEDLLNFTPTGCLFCGEAAIEACQGLQ